MPGQHALLSASASHRWLNCTAAPKLEACVKDTGSDFAAEGTLAHAYCAKALKIFLGEDITEELKEIDEYEKYYTAEMPEHVETYKTIVLEKLTEAIKTTPDATLKVETRLDLSCAIPEGFGTVDAAIIADDLLNICDFKYGKGVRVEAEYNPQMMIYALGALEEFGFSYDIKRVRMTIIQPRIDNLSEFEMSVEDLITWRNNILQPAAEEAYNTDGRQHAGEWCRFCKVKSSCRYLAVYTVEQLKGREKEKTLSAKELAAILPHLETITNWANSIQDFATSQAMNGEYIPGYKVVEGRSVRKVSDPETLCNRLQDDGFSVSDYMKPQELKALGDLEKLVGKKKFSVMAEGCIVKPTGKPTLVPLSDKRQAISAASDFDDIK